MGRVNAKSFLNSSSKSFSKSLTFLIFILLVLFTLGGLGSYVFLFSDSSSKNVSGTNKTTTSNTNNGENTEDKEGTEDAEVEAVKETVKQPVGQYSVVTLPNVATDVLQSTAFFNSQYKYYINLPLNFTSNNNLNLANSIGSFNVNSLNNSGLINVTVETTNPKTVKSDYIVGTQALAKQTFENFEVIEHTGVILPNNDANLVTYKYLNNGQTFMSLQLYTAYNNQMYVVTFVALEKDFNLLKDAVAQSFKTFYVSF